MGSERFEKSISEWYEKRGEPSEYLNLEVRTPKSFKTPIGQLYCFGKTDSEHLYHTKDAQLNYLADTTTVLLKNQETHWDRFNLSTRVHIRHFHKVFETLTEQKEQLLDLHLQVAHLKSQINRLAEIQASHQPLSKNQVLELVTTIAAQPKLVEEEAIRLTTALEKKVTQVQQQLDELNSLIHSVKALI